MSFTLKITSQSINLTRKNLVSGITVAIVALPLALAFGVSSGLGATYGLYGAIATGLFASLFGGTATQITGPTGPMTVVMMVVVTTFVGEYGVAQGLPLAFTAVMLAGCFQVLFGAFKWGNYIDLIPYPVITAFMSGIGFLIIILQIPTLCGLPSDGMKAIDIVKNIIYFITSANPKVLTLGAIVFVTTYIVPKKITQIIPSTLLALFLGTILSIYVFTNENIQVIGKISGGLPVVHFPVFKLDGILLVVKFAIVLAILGAIDSLLTSVVVDNITKTQHDPNKELRGQGIGNIVSGFIGGLPGAGATMRTLVNLRSGGNSKLSGVVHSIVLILILSVLSDIVKYIPLVALSGVLLRVGVDIVDWNFLGKIYKIKFLKAMIVIIVILLTVFDDILSAVGFGVFAFSLLAVKKLADQQINQIKSFTGGNLNKINFLKEENKLFKEIKDKISYFYISGPMSFGAVREMSKLINDTMQVRLVDLTDVSIIDLSSAMILSDFYKEGQASNKPTYFIIPERLLEEKVMKVMKFKKDAKNIFTNRKDAFRYLIGSLLN